MMYAIVFCTCIGFVIGFLVGEMVGHKEGWENCKEWLEPIPLEEHWEEEDE